MIVNNLLTYLGIKNELVRLHVIIEYYIYFLISQLNEKFNLNIMYVIIKQNSHQ